MILLGPVQQGSPTSYQAAAQIAAVLCRKPLNRRFIVVEGIYAQSGHLAPLDEVYKLKEQYKWAILYSMTTHGSYHLSPGRL